jgi:hypothetical protein
MSMTDQEKLQKLFDAALRDSSPVEKAPTRAVPKAAAELPAAPKPERKPVATCALAEPESTPQPVVAVPVLDKAAAEELGTLLDEQIRRKKRRRRIESLVTAVVLIGLTGGSAGWFVQSPERVHALVSAIAEIRSVGDVKSMVAKYDAALKKVSARGQQIDEATNAMGVKSDGNDEKDPNFDSEMTQMMGGEGRTTGNRANRMQQAFGKMKEEHGTTNEQVAASGEDESSEWNQ